MIRRLIHNVRHFRSETSGTAILEFAISLPLLLLVLAVIIEGSRMTWTHQAAASGVRDAARYLARTQAPTLCDNAGSLQAFNDSTSIASRAEEIVINRLGDLTATVLPNGIRDVTVDHELQSTTVNYNETNSAVVCVIEVAVTLTIDFPFGGVFGLIGQPLAPLTTRISDESRVYGT